MKEEQQELRRINWTEVFSFTHIFKSFKMAIHPSKLALALAAIIVVFLLGWVMDRIWTLGDQYVYPGEIAEHLAKSSWDFRADKEARQDKRLDQAAALVQDAAAARFSLNKYEFLLPSGDLRAAFGKAVSKMNENVQPPSRSADEIKKGKELNEYGDLLDEAEEQFQDEEARIKEALKEAEKEAQKTVKAVSDEKQKRQQAEKLEEDTELAKTRVTARKVEFARQVQDIRGETIFAGLLEYEQTCLTNAIRAVRFGNLFGDLEKFRQTMAGKAVPAMVVPARQVVPAAGPQGRDGAGFVYWLLLAGHAVCWLVCEHWVYALLFLLSCLAVTAFFGGAVHRIAALHFAREEKISVTQAVKFACEKFLSFFTAPLIPIAIILVVGLMLTLGGAIGSIPWIGGIIIGVLFFLAILLGLLIAFLLIGLLAGLPLMYPTIAVEGSDSFDAISRSFSYVFARPWRAGLYGLVALVYGVITYVFVRFFAFIALAATHYFVKWGVFTGGDSLHAEADKLDVMWQAPTFDRLFGPINWQAMGTAESIGGWLINMWVFLVAAAVLAYLLSFCASSTTAIYYLLRRKVDATDLDDVYVEEAEEEAPAADEASKAPAEGEQAEQPKAEPGAAAEGEQGGEEKTE